jgi:hypothetical protein
MGRDTLIRDLSKFPGYCITNSGKVLGKRKDILIPWITNAGYEQVGLYVNGKRVCPMVHKLVALTFLPEKVGCYEVNHIDEDKRNNSVDNLEWVTRQYNTEYSVSKHYKFISPNGEVFEVFNLNKFCKDLNLNSGHMYQVHLNNKNNYKGWRKA